jgi:hypothetical protein
MSLDCPLGIVDFKLFHFPIFCLWPDQGHCVPYKGHCIPDKGHCRCATCASTCVHPLCIGLVCVAHMLVVRVDI